MIYYLGLGYSPIFVSLDSSHYSRIESKCKGLRNDQMGHAVVLVKRTPKCRITPLIQGTAYLESIGKNKTVHISLSIQQRLYCLSLNVSCSDRFTSQAKPNSSSCLN